MSYDLTPIHPDLQDVIKKFPKLSINAVNVRLIQWLTAWMPAPKLAHEVQISQTRITADQPKRQIKLRIYQPKTTSVDAPALLWIHGGGLVIGSPKMHDTQAIAFVEALGIVVVSVDYRLAPQHPFPAAIDDCYATLQWMYHHAKTLGIDPQRIAIGGVSAGGGLAASLAQMAYDRAEIAVCFQLLIYPMLDDKSALLTNHPHVKSFTWTPENNRFGWESYLRQPVGHADAPPYAIPARRTNLTGLAPAWIGVGSLDLFYEENKAYAQQLKQSGVGCELLVIDGAFHGFDAMGADSPIIRQFLESQIDALRHHL